MTTRLRSVVKRISSSESEAEIVPPKKKWKLVSERKYLVAKGNLDVKSKSDNNTKEKV